MRYIRDINMGNYLLKNPGQNSGSTFFLPAYGTLKAVVLDKTIIGILPYLVDFTHTGNLEVYHSVLLKYCLKRLYFCYFGMVACTGLAILHFNNVIKAGHAVTKGSNIPRYKLQYSKIMQTYVVKPIKDILPKLYVVDLMDTIISLKFADVDPVLPSMPDIPASIAPLQKTAKDEAIRCRRLRFSI